MNIEWTFWSIEENLKKIYDTYELTIRKYWFFEGGRIKKFMK